MNRQDISRFVLPEPSEREFRLGAYFNTDPPYSVDAPQITAGWDSDVQSGAGATWWECRVVAANDGLTFWIFSDILDDDETPDAAYPDVFSIEILGIDDLAVIASALGGSRLAFHVDLLALDTSEDSDGLVPTRHEVRILEDLFFLEGPGGVSMLVVPLFARQFLAEALGAITRIDWESAIFQVNPWEGIEPVDQAHCGCTSRVVSPRSPEIQVCPDCGTRHGGETTAPD